MKVSEVLQTRYVYDQTTTKESIILIFLIIFGNIIWNSIVNF